MSRSSNGGQAGRAFENARQLNSRFRPNERSRFGHINDGVLFTLVVWRSVARRVRSREREREREKREKEERARRGLRRVRRRVKSGRTVAMRGGTVCFAASKPIAQTAENRSVDTKLNRRTTKPCAATCRAAVYEPYGCSSLLELLN